MPKTTVVDKDKALAELREARASLRALEADLDAARSRQGIAALAAQEAGATLTEIGDALGLSKQRAFDLIVTAKAAR